MRADVYQRLHEFNLHIEEGVAVLRRMAEIKKVHVEEVQRYADYFEEIRTSACGYLGSIFSGEELHDAGRLFKKRRRREMAEDPMHGGWLEEEREKKRLKRLRKADKSKRNKG